MWVALRVAPKAKRDAILGLAPTADGGSELKVSVTAPPENGKANQAVIALLAKTWRIPKSAMTIVRGTADRHKVVAVRGDPATLVASLSDRLTTISKQ